MSTRPRPTKPRQLSESLMRDWTVNYDLIYTRRKIN